MNSTHITFSKRGSAIIEPLNEFTTLLCPIGRIVKQIYPSQVGYSSLKLFFRSSQQRVDLLSHSIRRSRFPVFKFDLRLELDQSLGFRIDLQQLRHDLTRELNLEGLQFDAGAVSDEEFATLEQLAQALGVSVEELLKRSITAAGGAGATQL